MSLGCSLQKLWFIVSSYCMQLSHFTIPDYERKKRGGLGIGSNDYLLSWLYSPLLGLGRYFSFLLIYTVGRSPWTRDQPVARPLPTHGINAHNTDIHAFSRIRTHDPSFRATEDSSCHRLRGHWDRQFRMISNTNKGKLPVLM
jgi:hypothetical protein